MRIRLLSLAILVAVVTAAAAACGGGGDTSSGETGADKAATATKPADPNTLYAKKQAPASMAVDDAAWKAAAVMTAKTDVVKGTKATQPVAVSVQALYNDSDVWFRFQWADSTRDAGRPYAYDGSKWTLSSRMSDRVSLLWPMTPVAGFEAKGCYAACHRATEDAVDAEAYMILPKAGDKADNWQWTAESSAL